MENEIQTLQAGEERRGGSASRPNGCCFNPTILEQGQRVSIAQQEFVRQYRTPDAPVQWAGGEDKGDRERDWDDEKEQSGWYESAAVDSGVDSDRCQDANGGSGGGGNPSTPRNGTHARDSSRSPRGKDGKMDGGGWNFLRKEGEQENIGRKKEKNSQGTDPKTFQVNSQGRDPITQETSSQGKDPRTFREPVERWRVQKKRKEEQWEKKKKKKKKEKAKYRKRSWWKKVQRKDSKPLYGDDKKEKKGRQKKKQTSQSETSLGEIWKMSLSLLAFLGRIAFVSTVQQKDCRIERTEMMEKWQRQQEVRVEESRWAEEIPPRWKQPKSDDRTEIKKEARMLRCTLLNGSA